MASTRTSPFTPAIIMPIIAVTITIYVPLCIYLAYPAFRRRSEIIFKKRYILLSLWAVLSMVLTMITDSMDLLFRFVVWPLNAAAVINLNQALSLILMSIFISLILSRIWLIYFDCGYNALLSGKEWKSIICSSYDTSISFWMRYKSSLGNQSFMLRVLVANTVAMSIAAVLGLCVPLLDGLEIIVEAEMVLCFAVIVYIYVKLRRVSFFDTFHILNEFKHNGIASIPLIVLAIVLCTIIVTLRTLRSVHDQFEVYADICSLAVHQLFYWQILWAVYTMTRWVIREIDSDPALRKQYGKPWTTATSATAQQQQPRTVKFFTFTPTTSNTSSFVQNAIKLAHIHSDKSSSQRSPRSPRSQKEKMTVQMILENEEYLLAFMSYLSHEFSMECLLSLIEFTQFKQFALMHANRDNSETSSTETTDHEDPHLAVAPSTPVTPITPITPGDGQGTPVEMSDIETKGKTLLHVLDRMNSNTASMSHALFSTIKLTSCIPPSSIVYSAATLRAKATLLFAKYVSVGAKYEINIQHRVRYELTQKYGQRTMLQRFSSHNIDEEIMKEASQWSDTVVASDFDECCTEMRVLLGYSIARFKHSAEFARLNRLAS